MKKPVEIDHFAHYFYPSNIQARGEQIYFIGKRVNLEENRYDSALYTLQGGDALRLSAGWEVTSYALVGRDVLFPVLREEKDRQAAEAGKPLTVIYRLPPQGEAVEAFRLEMRVRDVYFLDENRFLFTAQYDPATERFLADAHGQWDPALEAIKRDSDYTVLDELPFWMNGEGVTNKKRTRLYYYNAGDILPVTDGQTSVEDLVLSPGKKSAVFSACTFGHVMPYPNRLMRLDLATMQVADISPVASATYGLHTYIDEDTLLVFLNEGRQYGIHQNDTICRYELPGKTLRVLYDGGEFCSGNAVGSDIRQGGPALMQLWVRQDAYYFISTLENSSYLVKGSLNGGSPAPLPATRGVVCEACPIPQGFVSISLHGNAGCEIYQVSPDGVQTRLSNLNRWILSTYNAVIPREISFLNENGQQIYGFVLPPADCQSGQKYPAILDIHGGPKGAYGPNFFHEMQYWAAQGYAVLFCNPTGSEGRGSAFADIRGAYGTVDYRDIMTFVDKALEAFPFLDAQRLGVTGGSYGGFMTNWIIGHTQRFRCAASQRSISNWVSFFGTSDIGYFFGPDQTAGTPWSDIGALWEQSPLKYADAVKTPTLFVHSDSDYRCWMGEGLQMFTALKFHGVPTRLCLFKDENHELSRSGKPLHRIRRLREITQWMDRYLKP